MDTKVEDSLQLIGIGLPRTGMSSIQAILTILDVGTVHHMRENFISLFQARPRGANHDKPPPISIRSEDKETLRNLMRGFAATFGSPTCCLAPELLATFPQAELILHIRSSDEAWNKSFSSSIGLDFERRTWRARVYRSLTFSIRWMHQHYHLCDNVVDYWRELYDGIGPRMHSLHNARIKALVAQEKLLVYDVKEGWGPLCDFLDVPVPEVLLPRANDAEHMRRIYLFLHVCGAAVWLLFGVFIRTLLWLS